MATVISNKKGQSLVEVTVSLTILAFVLTGSISLIVTVVNLSLQARTMTKVVTYAQSTLAKIVSQANGGCLVGNVPDVSGVYDDDPSITSISHVEDAGIVGEESGFKKATVTVSWDDRMGNRPEYVLSQLIRTAGE